MEKTPESWELPPVPDTMPAEAVEPWQAVRARLLATAKRFNWSKSEVARRSGIPNATFWQWLDGTYKGVLANISARVTKWLDSLEELSAAAASVPVAPGFIVTPTAQAVLDTLLYAQMMPEMVVINLGAGMGKTFACQHFCDTRTHAYLVTMRPSTSTVHGMLQELAQALDVGERNPARLDRAIGDRLRRNGRLTLLIVDEAQNLSDRAVDELRFFLDQYGTGIALVGNEELYGRFGDSKAKPAYAQLHRRIGKRLKRLQPLAEDIDMLADGWGVDDAQMRRVLHAIGRKPGALSQVTKTLQLAGMYAAGNSRETTLEDIRQAISNRGLEDH